MKKLYISADAFQRDCVRLAKKVLADASWRPDRILALWRGGAQPGVILSEVFAFLGRPTPHFVLQCSSYAGIGERLRCVSFCNADALISSITAGEKILVVDDVFDSGKTAEAIRAKLPQADVRIATVYWKPSARQVPFLPDYYVLESDEWIVFPHELVGLTPEEVAEKDPALARLLLS